MDVCVCLGLQMCGWRCVNVHICFDGFQHSSFLRDMRLFAGQAKLRNGIVNSLQC